MVELNTSSKRGGGGIAGVFPLFFVFSPPSCPASSGPISLYIYLPQVPTPLRAGHLGLLIYTLFEDLFDNILCFITGGLFLQQLLKPGSVIFYPTAQESCIDMNLRSENWDPLVDKNRKKDKSPSLSRKCSIKWTHKNTSNGCRKVV
jgi:hypothetical protein